MVHAAAARKLKDYTTLSNFNSAAIIHSHYELDVNFADKVIDGYAQLNVCVKEADLPELVLDTRDLQISSVQLAADGQPMAFSLGQPTPALGTPLHITLPAHLTPNHEVQLGIRFRTSPSASAVQWLEPAQTAGGEHPYLFTQCQAIHARSLLPCQDTPAVKMTYSAAVRVPAELRALMSAVPREDQDAASTGVEHLADIVRPYPTQVFHFEQNVPIPSYLVALAVGQLESRELSARSRVWSEPSMVEAGAYEFEETAKFLDAGEAIAGPYVWGRYDLLLLPPSFPYGGMENPCLTFVTPTLLAGDRSLTNVVAHEIAHSWTGNLVTNATWEDFWLNEGFTMLLERKIVGRLCGEASFQFAAANGCLSLIEEVKRFGVDHKYTALVPDLSDGADPDDAFSSIPYEKGFYFLYYLQALVGGPTVFEPFLRAYLDKFKFSTVTTTDFCEFFTHYFKDCAAISQVDWDTWLHKPGMPPVRNEYDTSLADVAYNLAVRWHTADVMGMGGEGPEGASAADVAGWSSDQLIAFLEKLGQLRSLTPLHKTITRRMAALYGLDGFRNAEIRCSWYKLAIAAEDEAVLPHVEDMLRTQGRMKFLRPLYRALFRSKMGRQLALDTFAACQGGYHPIAQKMVAADLQLR